MKNIRFTDFSYKVYPVNSFIMNKIFKIYEEKGLFAEVPQQPPAGKLQYYFEITDSKGTRSYLKDSPVVIRFKGDVPAFVLVPHILLMFIAMLFSTLAGLMAVIKYPLYKKYAIGHSSSSLQEDWCLDRLFSILLLVIYGQESIWLGSYR